MEQILSSPIKELKANSEMNEDLEGWDYILTFESESFFEELMIIAQDKAINLKIDLPPLKLKQYAQKILNAFQRACFSAYKCAIETDLTHKNFIRLFEKNFTIKNLEMFASSKFFIVFSSTSNQFCFTSKADEFTRKDLQALKRIKIKNPSDINFTVKDVISCKIIDDDDDPFREYGTYLYGFDKLYSISSSMIDAEDLKAKFRLAADIIPPARKRPYIDGPAGFSSIQTS